MGCFHGPNIEGAVCTRSAGTVSRGPPVRNHLSHTAPFPFALHHRGLLHGPTGNFGPTGAFGPSHFAFHRLYTARGGGVQGPPGRNHLAHVLFPSLSTTGVSSPPTQRGPPGTNHVSTTVPLGLLPKRHCFLLHTHGLGCEVRIKCGPTTVWVY